MKEIRLETIVAIKRYNSRLLVIIFWSSATFYQNNLLEKSFEITIKQKQNKAALFYDRRHNVL